eukprot:m.259385 g.259385  ORF g.259385 m.259385 type:complete len:99 (+) comp40418_c0_seq4:114-410(+)
MAFPSKIGPFNREQEEWRHYIERLQFSFIANDVTDEGKKKAVLLSVCAAAAYSTIRSAVLQALSTASFKTIVDAMHAPEHVDPAPSKVEVPFTFPEAN